MKQKLFFLLALCWCSLIFGQTAASHLNFDGNIDFVSVTSPFKTFTNQITVECWVKPTGTAGAALISQATPNTDNWATSNQFLLYINGGNTITFSINNGGSWINCDSTTAIAANTWSHIVGVSNTTGTYVYINGVLSGSAAGTTSILNNPTAQLNISKDIRYPSWPSFNGSIDEVRIWNTAESLENINRRKNCELQGNEDGLVEYYKFNQGIDASTNSTITTLNDATANLSNGTLTNFALTGATSNWLAGSAVTTGIVVPTAPTTSAQTFCGGDTVANLVPAASATINWYNVATGGTVLLSSTALATGTYYVSAVNANGCESLRTSVAVTVNALPTVNSISNQTICNGAATTAINFGGTANTYSWTNTNTSIGLAASGTGTIPSFNATNLGATAISTTISVTPTFAPFAYVANADNNNVSVINTATNTIVTTVSVGSFPIGVSVSPDGGKVYVANLKSNNVSVINTATNTVIATVTVGTRPFSVSVSPDGSKVYVVNNVSRTVSVINTATNTVLATVAVGLDPVGVSVSPDGSKVFVANSGSGTVSVINTATITVADTITVGTSPFGVSVSPDGSKVYVVNYSSNNVYVINTATNMIAATIAVGTSPFGISVSPDGSKVYVANEGSKNVSVINTATNTVVATVAVGTNSYPEGISVCSDGSKVYVTNVGSNTVSVINTATNTVAATVAVGSNPTSLGNFIATIPCSTGTPQTFTITVNATPAVPTTTTPQVYVGTATIANLTATETAIQWYAATTGGTALDSSTVLVDGTTYYASQTTSCGESKRTPVTVQKISEATQTFCDTATVTNLVSTPTSGTTANWFTTATGGTALASTDPVTTGTYYVEQNTVASVTTLGSGFNKPTGVAIQADGKIVVADTYNNAIKRMNADGTNIETLGSGFNLPFGVAVQADGKIVVADVYNNTIKRMNTDGSGIVILGSGFFGPYGIAIQADGKIVVADTFHNAIKRMNADGTNIETLGSGFNQPSGVAIQADGKIVVTESFSNAIKRMNTDGSGIVTLGNGLYGTYGVAIQADGKIVVAEIYNNTIKRMNTDGSDIVTLGSGFYDPYGVAIQADGKIVVADTSNHAIKRITEANTSNRVAVSVTVNTTPAPTFDAITPFCSGSTAPTLSATSVNGITGTWSPTTVSNTTSGTYTFTPTAGQCASTATLNVTVNPLPTVDAGPATVTYCADAITPITATATTAQATSNGFQGVYAPANWTFANNNSDGNINTTNAPVSITITGGNNGVTTRGDSKYSTTFASNTTVSFNWAYSTSESPSADFPQVIVNGTPTLFQGYNDGGWGVPTTQSGTMTVNVLAGQTFAFNMHSIDNINGAAIVTVSNLVITNSDVSYSWAATNGGSITGTNNTVSMTPATSGTYTVTATNANGCTATDSVAVIINPLTTPTFYAIAPFCSGSTASTLSGTSTNGITGTWSPTTVSNTTSGTYTFTPTAGQCASTATLNVAVNSLPTVDAGPATVTYCADAITPITGTSSSNGFQDVYAPSNWTFTNSNANGNVNTTNAPASINLIGGNNNSDVPGNSKYSITFTTNTTVSFNWAYTAGLFDTSAGDYPQVIINGTPTLFQGYVANTTYASRIQSGTMTVNVLAGQTFAFNMHTFDNLNRAANVTISNFVVSNSNISYSWAAINGGTITGATNTASMTPATSGTYTVTATNTAGCTATDSVAVTINATPAAPTATAQTFNSSATVANLSPAPSASIKWYANDTTTTALLSGASLSTGTYYVSQTTNGCESTRTLVSVTINAAPTDIALSATSIDENVATNSTVGTLSTTDPDAGDTFTYSLVAGTGSTDNISFNISGNSLIITNSPDFETKSSYSVRVRTTDQGGLSFEKVFTITINNLVEATHYYVKNANATSGDGTSWATAFVTLQEALEASGVTEIWVAQGTYKPTKDPFNAAPADPRDKTFFINTSITIYGGFAGNETLLSERNISVHPTILSGDIGVLNDSSDNVYHVVMTLSPSANPTLDGFTITGGNANGTGSVNYSYYIFERNNGGGMYSNFTNSSCENLIFKNNNAANDGGGMYVKAHGATIDKTVFYNNTAGHYGGGLANFNFNSYGVNATISNSVFVGNTATNNGGAIDNNQSSPTITNVTVANNHSDKMGGGISNCNPYASPVIKNCIIYGNTAGMGMDNQTHDESTSPTYSYCVIEGGATAVNYTNIITTNPNFANSANPIGSDAIWMTSDDGLALSCGSSAYNSGTNTGVTTTDIIGNARPLFSTADVGAYESTIVIITPTPTITASGLTTFCTGGSVTLTSSAATGNTWSNGATTQAITVSTAGTYTVAAASGNCTSSSSVGATVTVNTTPTVTATTPASRCGTGTLTLGATASAGTLNWFADATGGSSLGTGTSYTTPSISATTTYYVEASNNGCTSTRTTVTASVNIQPAKPTLACYQTAAFNTTSCQWDVTGTQAAKPALACYQTATFNTTSCQWDVTGTQAVKPALACYQTATFNTTTCSWNVTGTQAVKPALACYQTATFNTTSCQWDVTGTQAVKPALACYQTAAFNTTSCQWDVTGTQATKPTLACYQTATFNTTSCQWDVTGTQAAKPALACYQTATFNTTTCVWDVTGTQSAKPALACYQTATFNTTTCQWDVTGTQAATPTGATMQTISVTNPTLVDLVLSSSNVVWYSTLVDALAGTNPLANTTVLLSGNTYYAVNVVNTCFSSPFAVTVTLNLSKEEFDIANFTYYPNPTSGILNIQNSKEISEVSVINLLGQTVLSKQTKATEVQMDFSNLPNETYFVKVVSEGKVKIIKVSKGL